MQISECLENIGKGREEFHRWRALNGDRKDVNKADFSGKDLSGWNLSEINFNSTNFEGANLTDTNLSGSLLFHANLTDADLTSANCSHVTFRSAVLKKTRLVKVNLERAKIEPDETSGPLLFDECKLLRTDLSSQSFCDARFMRCDLDGANCQGARFERAHFDQCQCVNAIFQNARFTDANLSDTNFYHAHFQSADLTRADIGGTNFLEAEFTKIQLREVKNARTARNLERTITPGEPTLQPLWFETAQRSLFDRWFDWEGIKSFGRMQLFGVSYFLMIYLVTTIYVIGEYNSKLGAVKAWAQSEEAPKHLPGRVLTDKLLELNVFPISKTSVLLLAASMILVAASMIYTFACPAEIKDFSSAEWRYAHNRSLVHYWPLSWRRPLWRTACVALYAVGALILVPITFFKLLAAMQYAWQFSVWSF